MISLDYSIIPAVLIFLTLVVSLNYLLFKPLMEVQAKREERTTGLMEQARKKLVHQSDLFSKYQAAIKNARVEGYRLQEQVRSEAAKKRVESLAQARKKGEDLVQDSRTSIHEQVQAAKEQLGREAQEIARGIVESIMQRSA